MDIFKINIFSLSQFEAQMFNHSLALVTVEMFYNLILRNHWT